MPYVTIRVMQWWVIERKYAFGMTSIPGTATRTIVPGSIVSGSDALFVGLPDWVRKSGPQGHAWFCGYPTIQLIGDFGSVVHEAFPPTSSPKDTCNNEVHSEKLHRTLASSYESFGIGSLAHILCSLF